MAFIKSRCWNKRIWKQAKGTRNSLQSNHAESISGRFSRRKLRLTVWSRATRKPSWTKCRWSRLKTLIDFFSYSFFNKYFFSLSNKSIKINWLKLFMHQSMQEEQVFWWLKYFLFGPFESGSCFIFFSFIFAIHLAFSFNCYLYQSNWSSLISLLLN